MPEEGDNTGFWAEIAIIATIIVSSFFYELGARINKVFSHKSSNGFSFKDWIPYLIAGAIVESIIIGVIIAIHTLGKN
jgi:hypothetical protein